MAPRKPSRACYQNFHKSMKWARSEWDRLPACQLYVGGPRPGYQQKKKKLVTNFTNFTNDYESYFRSVPVQSQQLKCKAFFVIIRVIRVIRD